MAVILRERMWVTADDVLLSEPISSLGFRGRAGGLEGWGQGAGGLELVIVEFTVPSATG